MVEFEVVLKQKDIKSFILYNMGVYKLRFFLPLGIYFFCSIFFIFFGIFVNSSYFFVIFGSIFFCLFLFGVLKSYSIFKKMFVESLKLVGKKRIFVFNEICLTIEYSNDIELCGRYFFYDLKKYKKVKECLYLYFNHNIFIILPIKALKKEQYKKVIDILENSYAK